MEWSEEDIARALAGYEAGRPLADVAATLGRTAKAVRNALYRRGLLGSRLWSDEDTQKLVDTYARAGAGGFLGLESLAKEMGRDAGNLSRKAGQLGLQTSANRLKVAEKKPPRVRKFATKEELRDAQSEIAKKRIRDNGHPRGALGLRHSAETLAIMSEKSKACWAARSEEEREAHTAKMVATRIANGATPPQTARGTWKAGWREIGGKRNYYRSRWEANYARYLEWLKGLGEIKDWAHEPETFWFDAIRRGTRSYKPDFRVWEADGRSALHEVKGWMDQRSRTCLDRMARYHPSETIIVIDGRQYRAIRLKVMSLIPDWEDSARDRRA